VSRYDPHVFELRPFLRIIVIWYCEFMALEDISKMYKDRSRTNIGIYINSCFIGFFLAPKSLHFSQVFHSLFSRRHRKLKDSRLIKDSNVVICASGNKGADSP
jgi:hypothetical protein